MKKKDNNVVILKKEKDFYGNIRQMIKEATGINPISETLKTIKTKDFEISIQAEDFENFKKRVLHDTFGDDIPDEKDIKPLDSLGE